MSWQDIPGWFDWQPIYTRAVETAPKGAYLVEIGVAFGRSVAFLASEAIRLKRDDLRIVAIDPWVDDWNPDWKGEADRPAWGAEHAEWARSVGGPFCAFLTMMLKHAPAELERIQVLRGRSAKVASAVRWVCGECDPYGGTEEPNCWLVFIDGDHRLDAVREDIEVWSGAIMPGGILAGHDYTPEFPGVMQAVADIIGTDNVLVAGTSWVRR